MKRTEMKRTTPMPRGTSQLRRATGLDARGNLPRLSSPSGAGKRKTPRETGFSQAAKLLIRTRAGNGDPADARCEATGVFLGAHGGEIQHRNARRIGGSRLRNNVANGVLLSHDAHRLAESRDRHSRAQGFWLLSTQDSRQEPIMLHGPGGGLTVWLDDSGNYLHAPPMAVSA